MQGGGQSPSYSPSLPPSEIFTPQSGGTSALPPDTGSMYGQQRQQAADANAAAGAVPAQAFDWTTLFNSILANQPTNEAAPTPGTVPPGMVPPTVPPGGGGGGGGVNRGYQY